MVAMDNRSEHLIAAPDAADQGRRRTDAAKRQSRRRLVGAVTVTGLALLAALMSIAASGIDPASGGAPGLLGGHGLVVLTIALSLGGAFIILRAAMSHDDFSRRLEGLCQELESSHEQLKGFSFKDELTGLYNRRFFTMRLEDEVSRYSRFDHPLAVVVLDVDGLKSVNDALGHAAGDQMLREIAAILERCSRSVDVVCRYGGDEFAVLLVETGRDGALLYAERIRRQVEAAQAANGRAVTVSAGVAVLPDDVGPVPEDIVGAADWALYEAKREGKNQVAGREGVVAIGRGRRGGWDL